MAEICHLENRHDVIFLPCALRVGFGIKFRRLVQNDMPSADCGNIEEREGSGFIYLTLKAFVRITQFYLQITPYLPLPRISVHYIAPPQTEIADI